MLLIGVAPICAASYGTDFSGTWVLDKDRSFSNPAGLDQTLVVTQTGDQLKVDVRLVTAQGGERTLTETYVLDGKETDFTPVGAQEGTKGKRKASWLPDHRGILVDDEITSTTPQGSTVQKVARKWTLSADGKTLTVDYYFDNQQGSFEAKRVFAKK